MAYGTGLLLLSAVAGYWVLERSATHNKGNLKRIGQAVGWFVILCSIVGIACKVYSLASCPPGSKTWFCPFSPKTSSPVPPAK